MNEYKLFVAPESLAKTPQAEIVALLQEDEGAMVYQGLRQLFIDLSRPRPASRR